MRRNVTIKQSKKYRTSNDRRDEHLRPIECCRVKVDTRVTTRNSALYFTFVFIVCTIITSLHRYEMSKHLMFNKDGANWMTENTRAFAYVFCIIELEKTKEYIIR